MSAPNADKSTLMFAPGHQGVAKVMPQSKPRQAGLLLGTLPKEGPQGLSRVASCMAPRVTTLYACWASNGRGGLGHGVLGSGFHPAIKTRLMTPLTRPKMQLNDAILAPGTDL